MSEPLYSERERQRHPIQCWHSDTVSPSTMVAIQNHEGEWSFWPLHERFGIHCNQEDLQAFCRKVLNL